jgi:hypothetical protein
MYRFLLSLSLASSLLIISSCSGNKPNNGQPVKGTESRPAGTEVVLNEKFRDKFGSWMAKGVECYGIVVTTPDKAGKAIGKSVKCKVIDIKPDKIKVKAIETVKLMENKGCDKLGISYGETWWEEEGDLFKTREEADNLLKSKGWLAK